LPTPIIGLPNGSKKIAPEERAQKKPIDTSSDAPIGLIGLNCLSIEKLQK
jgi:hypothetical protein